MLTGAVALLMAAGCALLLWPGPGSTVTRRVRALRTPPAAGAERPPAARPSPKRRWVLAALTGTATVLLIGGPAGAVAGVVGSVVAERLLRRPSEDDARADRAQLVQDLPGACDLLAVCLSAGVPVVAALAAVAAAVPAPLGTRLATVAGLYRLGAEPRRAWADVPDVLAPLGRVLVRAGESGAAVAPALRSLAADCRTEARAGAEAGVRRAGIWILAPLGLCFLPAFVCLGVVPLVLGIAAEVFG